MSVGDHIESIAPTRSAGVVAVIDDGRCPDARTDTAQARPVTTARRKREQGIIGSNLVVRGPAWAAKIRGRNGLRAAARRPCEAGCMLGEREGHDNASSSRSMSAMSL